MTKERAVRAWTNYPINELGDRPGKIAPVRLVDALSFHRDKYCRMRVDSVVGLVKRCYLYRPRGRCGQAARWSDCQLKKPPITRYGDNQA
jgi:hypothetical protein